MIVGCDRTGDGYLAERSAKFDIDAPNYWGNKLMMHGAE
jgi:hypothetical protein